MLANEQYHQNMNTMNIAIPEKLKAFVRRQVAERGYSSVSEYMRNLIRADLKQQTHTTLEAEILKGLESGPMTPMVREDWQKIRYEVKRRSGQRRTR